MTKDKAEKAVIRERMQSTGESYTAARAQLSSPETTPAEATRMCSFCGKTQDQTPTLIAGPGVHICRDCIELCAEIVSEESSENPTPRAAPTEAQTELTRKKLAEASTIEARLARLTGLGRSRSQIDGYVATAVHALRASGVSWAPIAQALGVTTQWAQEHYAEP